MERLSLIGETTLLVLTNPWLRPASYLSGNDGRRREPLRFLDQHGGVQSPQESQVPQSQPRTALGPPLLLFDLLDR